MYQIEAVKGLRCLWNQRHKLNWLTSTPINEGAKEGRVAQGERGGGAGRQAVSHFSRVWTGGRRKKEGSRREKRKVRERKDGHDRYHLNKFCTHDTPGEMSYLVSLYGWQYVLL